MLSVFSWGIIIISLLIIKYVFLLPLEDRRLFSMYAARDAVAMAATRGEVSQDSKEYRFVIDEINFEIYYTKNNYNFGILVNNLLRRPEEAKKYFDSMYKLIEQYEVLAKNRNKVQNKFIQNLAFRLKMFNILIIRPVYYAMSIILVVCENLTKITKMSLNTTEKINRKRHVVKIMKNDYATFKNGFTGRLI